MNTKCVRGVTRLYLGKADRKVIVSNWERKIHSILNSISGGTWTKYWTKRLQKDLKNDDLTHAHIYIHLGADVNKLKIDAMIQVPTIEDRSKRFGVVKFIFSQVDLEENILLLKEIHKFLREHKNLVSSDLITDNLRVTVNNRPVKKVAEILRILGKQIGFVAINKLTTRKLTTRKLNTRVRIIQMPSIAEREFTTLEKEDIKKLADICKRIKNIQEREFNCLRAGRQISKILQTEAKELLAEWEKALKEIRKEVRNREKHIK